MVPEQLQHITLLHNIQDKLYISTYCEILQHLITKTMKTSTLPYNNNGDLSEPYTAALSLDVISVNERTTTTTTITNVTNS